MAYAALFFPRLAAAFVALIAAAFGLGLLVSDIPGMLTPWVLVSVTTATVGAVLAGVSRGVRRHLQTDTLTGTLNRDGLQAAAGRVGIRARRRSEQITVAALDLDAFKQINDRDGHAAGDRLLTDAAAAWRAALRSDDILARIGGDEFVVIMPGTSPDEARTVLARLRQAHPVRWSAGVARWRSGEPLEACLQRADRRLYAAKGLPNA